MTPQLSDGQKFVLFHLVFARELRNETVVDRGWKIGAGPLHFGPVYSGPVSITLGPCHLSRFDAPGIQHLVDKEFVRVLKSLEKRDMVINVPYHEGNSPQPSGRYYRATGYGKEVIMEIAKGLMGLV